LNQWADKNVLVLGLGETGLSMLRWLSAQGARLRVADSRSEPPGLAEAGQFVSSGQIFCGAFGDDLLDGIELIAISPGIPLAAPLVQRAAARGIPVVGDIELFAQQLRIQDSGFRPKVLAITGSNGKTTVTSMVEHLCRAAGKDAVAAGNISPAVLDMVLARGANQPEGGQGCGGGRQHLPGGAGYGSGARCKPARSMGAGIVQLPARDDRDAECRCGDGAECQRRPSRPLCRYK